MCELMAMSFDRPASADFSLREFALRGEENADGWGLAWYPDRSLAIVKEPLKWASSRYASFLETYPTLLSRIYLAHVRHKTMGGEPTHADTHPFHREMGGRDYCFAHNGTLDGPAWDLPLGRHLPLGETDSERFFCHLLGEDATPEADRSTRRATGRWLHQLLALGQPIRQARHPSSPTAAASSSTTTSGVGEGPELPQGPGSAPGGHPNRHFEDQTPRPRSTSTPGRSTTGSSSRPVPSARPAGIRSGSAS